MLFIQTCSFQLHWLNINKEKFWFFAEMQPVRSTQQRENFLIFDHFFIHCSESLHVSVTENYANKHFMAVKVQSLSQFFEFIQDLWSSAISDSSHKITFSFPIALKKSSNFSYRKKYCVKG